MGYDVTLKPPKEEVEKLKETNKHLLTVQSFDNSIYYEFLINLYNLEYDKSKDFILFKFKPVYYYIITTLSYIYEAQKKECLQDFFQDYDKDGEVDYCGWDKNNCTTDTKENIIEEYLKRIIKCIYCSNEEDKESKLQTLEDYIDDFKIDAYHNEVYNLIILFNKYKTESY